MRLHALAAVFSIVLVLARASAQPETPQMVAPESLPQGFIIIVQDKAKLASDQQPIYIGSNHVNWSANDATMKMSPRSDMRWQIVMPPLKGDKPFEFKFTRGSWDTVEISPDMSDSMNRRLEKIDASKLAPGELPRFEFVVEKWADQRPDAQARRAMDSYRELKATGDVRRVQVIGGGGRSLIRDALVWLPPGYDAPENADRRYAVLYMQDGQNLFENHPGIPAEWSADETATRLIESGEIEPVIIVGIPHSGPFRVSEYLTVRGAIEGVDAHGEEYANWLAQYVVPRIDAAFRTRANPESRAVGGSSLGALVALHAAAKHPRVFGKVLAESPALVLGDSSIVEQAFDNVRTWPHRVFMAVGGKEFGAEPTDSPKNDSLIAAVRELDKRIRIVAAQGNTKELLIVPEAAHNEKAWAERFPQALKFLFPADGQ